MKHRLLAKLLERSGLNRQLFDLMPDALVVTDETGEILFLNTHAEALFGYSRDELLGQSVDRLAPRRLRRRQSRLLADYAADLEQRTVMSNDQAFRRRKDGSEFPAELQLSRIELDGSTLIAATVRDISRRRAREREVQETESRYRSIFEVVPSGIYVSNLEGLIIDANQFFLDLFGYAPADLGSLKAEQLYANPTDRERFLDAIASTGSIRDFRLQLRTKTETKLDCLLNTTRRQFDDGRPSEYVGVVRNVTEIRRMERELRQSQRLEAVGALAGGIAHDFNNILTAILGSAELIVGDLEDGSLANVESARFEAREIRRSAQRAGALTYQLLAFSRRQVLQPEIVNLNSVVTSTQTMLHRLIGEHITLETRLADDLAAVKVDPSNMEQVVVNLAVNARDAMPRGGKLTIRTANAELDESFAREHPPTPPGRYVMLSVEDTGEGMHEETSRRVFEPFFTTKEHSTGTGLGLSTVYGIVKQSLGYIWFDTEPDRGTTFSVYLQPIAEAVELPDPHPEQQVVPIGSETILVTEDEGGVRKVLCAFLTSYGYTVLEADDGDEAMAVAAAFDGPIDLLVTDVVMARVGGAELAERLVTSRPGIRVLYVSGYADREVLDPAAFEAGASFLQKPFSSESLATKVREVLEKPPPAR